MIRIGLDVGGTKTRGIALDGRGATLADVIRPTQPGPEGVVSTALTVTRDCLRIAGADSTSLFGVGVGIPGQVDPDSGTVTTAVNLGIDELDLGPRLEQELNVSVQVDNDVKAAAVGAGYHLGQADLTYLNFGTGVASATLIDGRLVRGTGNVAGELGHMPIHPNGPVCACGQRGCVETYAGGRWVAERLARATQPLELATLRDCARRGYEEAQAELDQIATAIGATIQMAVLAYGSPTVVLSGGVVQTAEGLDDAIRERLTERAELSPFLRSLHLTERVIQLSNDAPVAVLGAALLTGHGALVG